MATLIALTTIALTAPAARAQMGPPPGPPGGPPPIGALLIGVHLTADQQAQVKTIMDNHRQAADPLHQQLDAKHQELSAKLTQPGSLTLSDLTPLDQEIAHTEAQLHQEMLKAALEIRAILTPDQLATAAANNQKLAQIHGEMRDLLGPPPNPGDAP